jgi:hypothetical protein
VTARTRWSASALEVLDTGPFVAPDGRSFTFRLSNGHPGAKRGAAVVYVVRSGDSRAHAIYRHPLGPSGCAVGGSMGWHGHFILYSSADGQRAILDSRSGTVVDLAKLARTLPRLAPANAYWASEFHY